jgi:ribosomal RNA-processing protein 36
MAPAVACPLVRPSSDRLAPPAAQSAEHGAVREGKRPFYLKKSEQRRLELLARYEELQASGKLEQYMAKRRKRNAAKDHRYLPGGRRPGGGDDGDEQ